MKTGQYIRTTKHREKARLLNLGNQIRLGVKLSNETRKKISDGNKGKFVSLETRLKLSKAGKGRKLSKEHKEKLRQCHIGKKSPWFSEMNKSKEHIKLVSGKNNVNWKGGVTPINEKIRKSTEYKIWRKAVYERDNYTCIWCGVIGNGKNLHADHIKPFSLYPELRFAIDNGRTLCVDCHIKTDTYGWKAYHQKK